VWDNAALEIEDFAPLLESSVARAATGSTAHMARYSAPLDVLAGSARTAVRGLEFFGREGMSVDESAAFEGVPVQHDERELATLRARGRSSTHRPPVRRGPPKCSAAGSRSLSTRTRSIQWRFTAATSTPTRCRLPHEGQRPPDRTAPRVVLDGLHTRSSCKAVSLGCCSLGAAPAKTTSPAGFGSSTGRCCGCCE